MTGTSILSSYTGSGYKIAGISYGSRGISVHRANYTPKKNKPKYNYKLISAAILRAKTPSSASMAAMKARKKLGELLQSVNTDGSSDPDIRAAIIHVKKMELIAKRKEKHLEQEQLADQGLSSTGEDKTEETLDEDKGMELEESIAGEFDEVTSQIEEELSNLSQEMAEKAMEEFTELTMEMLKSAQKIMEEEMPALEGFEDVSHMSQEDVEELKRKHRNDELRDITKADMDYLKAKFYRLQQEKAMAGAKGLSFENSFSEHSGLSPGSINISIDVSFDTIAPVAEVGSALDTFV